jgi:hypothetical protein
MHTGGNKMGFEIAKKSGLRSCEGCAKAVNGTCDWARNGGDGEFHLVCPRWENKDVKTRPATIMHFEQYGDLEWLETADYYAGAWSVVEGTAVADDGECYTVVISLDKTDMRYTIT